MAKKSQSQVQKTEGKDLENGTEKRFLDPKNDVSFKKIFGEEASKPLLVSFINSLLELEGEDRIEVIELLNPQQLPVAVDRKFTVIDILCQDQRKHRYVVEMQLGQHPGFEKRAQLYSSRTYVSQHKATKPYVDLKPVVFLGILNYVAFHKEEGFKTEHLLLTKKTYKHYLQDIRYFFVELPKFTKLLSELETLEDKWLFFLKHAPEAQEIPESLAKEKPIAEAYGVLERYKWSEAQLLAYEHARLDEEVLWAQKEEGRVEGLQEGLEKGKLEERKAMVKKLFQKEISLEIIAETCGFSKEELKEILRDEQP